VPFSPDETAAKMREFRKRWGITQETLGDLLGLGRDVIIVAEKGRPRPMGIAFAIAWVDFYGSRLPSMLAPIPRCPHCGK
jgi:DNA-binding XRE family transcriptional regulator